MATMRFLRLHRFLSLAPIIALVGALSFTLVAQADGVPTTAISYKASGYTYQQVAIGGGPTDFMNVAFDDSAWNTGSAGFGSLNNTCTWNKIGYIQTEWDPMSDILIRKHFTLPPGAHNLRIAGTVDNDATVFLNGTQVGSVVKSGFCSPNAINLSAPDSLLTTGDNVLAIRGHDYGEATYLDLQVTFDDGPAFGIGPLFDQSKAHKSGSTVPIKLQVLDGSGANASAESLVVQAVSLVKSDNTATGVVDDSGSANSPDDNFRYDAALGGYIYNLSTKGLTTGTWVLSFTVNGEADSSYVVHFDIR